MRVDLAKPGEPTRLTERGWWNAATMDQGGHAADRHRARAPTSRRRSIWPTAAANGSAWINENAIDGRPSLCPYLASHRPTQFGTLKAADGTTLHWKMITPPLEPGKQAIRCSSSITAGRAPASR